MYVQHVNSSKEDQPREFQQSNGENKLSHNESALTSRD
ncbi:hypothetical protein CDS [Bradyrhizobium sp.]|nr:hypothetical protein CDS [Bradyrhizobium sp.]